jgi:hypothetical protein
VSAAALSCDCRNSDRRSVTVAFRADISAAAAAAAAAVAPSFRVRSVDPRPVGLAAPCEALSRSSSSFDAAARFRASSRCQGLKLVHFSAQHKHILWNTLGA